MKYLEACAVGNDYGITDGEAVIAVFSDERHPGEAEPNASRAKLAAIMLGRAPFFLRMLERLNAPATGEEVCSDLREELDPISVEGLRMFRDLIERAKL